MKRLLLAVVAIATLGTSVAADAYPGERRDARIEYRHDRRDFRDDRREFRHDRRDGRRDGYRHRGYAFGHYRHHRRGDWRHR